MMFWIKITQSKKWNKKKKKKKEEEEKKRKKRKKRNRKNKEKESSLLGTVNIQRQITLVTTIMDYVPLPPPV